MAAPLSGIRVIEVANYVAGPAVGALMRDLGADVVKVEPPGGEVMRGVIVPGADGPYSANFLFELENRGKRSLTLDLGVAGASEVIHRLMGSADVFLTNLLAPRMEKYGLTPTDILARNPKAIVCSVTGYGIEGAEAARPGFDFAAFWARAGIMSVVGHPGGPPVLSRIAQGDHTTGINALAAILAALRLRDQTGEGQVVEVTLQQTGAYTIATDISRTLVDGKQPSRLDREAPANPLFNTYQTADGNWVLLVHMTPDPYWPRLCAAIDEPSWATDERYSSMRKRIEHGAALAAGIQARFAEHDLAHWAEKLDEHGLIWAPMVDLTQVVSDPALARLNAFPEVPHPNGTFRTVGVPFSIRGADIGVRGAASDPGADTFDVLAESGFGGDEISDLAAKGLLG